MSKPDGSTRKTNNGPRQSTKQGSASKNLRKLSHSLSWALRHAAPELGLTMSPDGYVPLEEILTSTHPRLKGWTQQEVEQVVSTSDKQRYKLEERPLHEGSAPVLCIRANQGHSIPNVDTEALLTRIAPQELKKEGFTVVHGTSREAWENHICKEGLSRMNRNHIHFASGLPRDDGVISGMRKSCQVHIFVDGARCAADDIEFFRSDNGVILTSGVENKGILPSKYFSYVTDSSGSILIDQRS